MDTQSLKDITQEHFDSEQAGVSHYKNDVYSLALMILEVCTLEKPSMDISYRTHLDQIEEQYGVKFRFMLEGMLAPKAADRPTFEQLVDYLREIQN